MRYLSVQLARFFVPAITGPLLSPDTLVIRRPMSESRVPVVVPNSPVVSTVMGSNKYLLPRASYFWHFLSSTLRAALPADTADSYMWEAAKVSMQVASQHRHFPLENGKTEIQSGRLPSPLSTPTGSSTEGMPALCNALLITSLKAECLGCRPALYLQDSP